MHFLDDKEDKGDKGTKLMVRIKGREVRGEEKHLETEARGKGKE